jgi:hypothetical protein
VGCKSLAKQTVYILDVLVMLFDRFQKDLLIPDREQKGVHTMTRILSILSLVATAIFVLAILILLFLPTGVNPMISGISFYALTRYGYLLTLAIFSVGVSGIMLALALWPVMPSTAGRIGVLLLIAWGLVTLLAGVFPLDPPGAPPTLSGRIHNMAGMSFLLFTAALLLIELSRSNSGQPRRPRTITFWLAWMVLAASVLLFTFNGPLYSLEIGGLIQRLYWLVSVLWLMYKALQLRRQEQSQPA